MDNDKFFSKRTCHGTESYSRKGVCTAFVDRLNDSEAKVLITDHEHVGVVMDHGTEMPGLKRIIVTDGRVPGTTFWGDLLSAASPEFDVFPTRAEVKNRYTLTMFHNNI